MCIYPVPSTALDALSVSSYVNFTGTPKARYYFSFQKIFQMRELRLRRFHQCAQLHSWCSEVRLQIQHY